LHRHPPLAKHPPLAAAFIDFIQWAWRYGEREGNCKISAYSLCQLAELHGTVEGSNKFLGDLFWKVTGEGGRTFSVHDIAEVWRVKQFYATMSTRSKAEKKPLQAKTARRFLEASERRDLIHRAIQLATADQATSLFGLNAAAMLARFDEHEVGDSTISLHHPMTQKTLQVIMGDTFRPILRAEQKKVIVALLMKIPKHVDILTVPVDIVDAPVAIPGGALLVEVDGDGDDEEEGEGEGGGENGGEMESEEIQLDEFEYSNDNEMDPDEEDEDDA
jgi:hypothetical protein